MKLRDASARRVHPRLRVIYNGDDLVNRHRAAISGVVTSARGARPPEPPRDEVLAAELLMAAAEADETLAEAERTAVRPGHPARPAAQAPTTGHAPPPAHGDGLDPGTAQADLRTRPRTLAVDPDDPARLAREAGNDAPLPPWQPPRTDVRVSTFVELEGEGMLPPLRNAVVRSNRRLATVELPVAELARLAAGAGVAYVSGGEVLEPPNPITAPGASPEPPSRAVDPGARGRDAVLIGIIDVGGFDFAHPDFLHAGGTRFVRIWDQGLTSDPADPAVPYGRQLAKALLDDAIGSAAHYGLPAVELVRQSAALSGAHATHVASIAGGNLGVCPNAMLAGVTIALPVAATERTRSFFDSARLAHAVDYLFALGEELRVPVVINVSLGTNGHAHDGSSPISRWIEAALDRPGRAVVVAAGNAGQEDPRLEGDLGFLSGRIHASGRVAASGLERDLEWEVLGDGRADLSENEMEIWYEPQDRFEVALKAPGSERWIGPVAPGTYVENQLLDSGTLVSIYSERYHPANGANRISVFLSPRLREPVTGVEVGTWTVRLRGTDVRDGRFHAWIERDDIRPVQRLAGRGWALPSVFARTSNVDNSSVNSLACGARVLAVANYDEANEHVHISSSQGPTRDGRAKPEVAGPGTAIVAANGFARSGHEWVAKTGTSMASPHVAGVVACMLAREPRLSASQIIGMVRRTAQPLPGDDYHWQDAAGFGRIRPGPCLDEVAMAFQEVDVEKP